MKLYLIRHAESMNNALWSMYGTEALSERTADPEISETGHKQATQLAQHFATPGMEMRQTASKSDIAPDYQLKHLYCSLMNRSLQTAEYIQQTCDLELHALPDVFERKGLYDVDEEGKEIGIEGPGRRYFQERFPHVRLPDTLTEAGWWNKPVEPDGVFYDRVASSLQSIVDTHGDSNDSVALVVHGDYLDQCINHIMDVPRKTENYQTPWVANWVFHNTSISRIDIDRSARNVIYLNRIDHLPAEHVTW